MHSRRIVRFIGVLATLFLAARAGLADGCGQVQLGSNSLYVTQGNGHWSLLLHAGPAQNALVGDPLESWTPPPGISGKVAYCAEVPVKQSVVKQPFLVVRSLGSMPSPGSASAAPIQVFPLASDFSVFNPSYSPDGKWLLLEVGGFGDPHGDRAYFCLWDQKRNFLEEGTPEDIGSRIIRWSPDSQYIAFESRGRFGAEVDDAPLNLYVFEVSTGRTQLIAAGVDGTDLSWTPQGSLLFASARNETISDETNSGQEGAEAGVFEFRPEKGTPKLLTPFGVGPQSSPDGKWVLCRGVAAPDQVTDNENKDTVGLFCRADQSLRLFPFMNSENKCFLWESDSQSLLTLKWIEGKSNETLRVGRIWLAALNSPRPDPPVATTVRPVPVEPVAEVTLAEADSRQSTGMLPMIEPLALQSDSNHLFYVTAEYSKEPKSYGYDVRQALGCLDLRTGKCAQVLSLFSFEPEVKGIGWYSGRP